MSKNLVLTAAVGYNFAQVELFIKSLRKYHVGPIAIIIDENNYDLKKNLRINDCDIIETNSNKKKIQFMRYKIFINYLRDKTFDKILLCDSRDIYFQNDPFNYNYHGNLNFFLEDYKIKDCPYNSNWITKIYGKDQFNTISEKTILCSGTVIGNYKKIFEYLTLMMENINKFRYKKKIKYFLTFRTDPEERGCDQGHANYLIHKSKIDNVNFYSNAKGPFATVYYLKKVKFDEKQNLVNESGAPYILVHQYDKRWEEFSRTVNIIKKSFGII